MFIPPSFSSLVYCKTLAYWPCLEASKKNETLWIRFLSKKNISLGCKHASLLRKMRQLETQKKLINIWPRNIGGFIPGTSLSLAPFATGDSRPRRNTNYTKKDIEVIFGATTISITTFSTMALSIWCLFVTVRISDSQHNNALPLCWVSHFIYRHVECLSLSVIVPIFLFVNL
jgi:hypothetical protein